MPYLVEINRCLSSQRLNNQEGMMKSFISRYGTEIKGVISGWDRLAFRGTLRWLSSVSGLGSYLSSRGILLKDFSQWARGLTGQIRSCCEQVADELGIRAVYLHR